MLRKWLGQRRSTVTHYKYQTPNNLAYPNFRPHIAHLGPRIFKPQIIWPDPNCRPQISKLALRFKSQRVPPGHRTRLRRRLILTCDVGTCFNIAMADHIQTKGRETRNSDRFWPFKETSKKERVTSKNATSDK